MPPPHPPVATRLDVLVPSDWRDYALLDSGDGEKLERWGRYTLRRPEPAALWRPARPRAEWERADAVFHRGEGEGGQWQRRAGFEEPWPVRWRYLTALARLTPFRHTGIFPEQAGHWTWIDALLRAAERPEDGHRPGPAASPADEARPRVLNLFGYTGLASLVAAAAGAAVVHVDASRKAIGWAQENARASGLADRPIRWILDDVPKFVRRDSRRGARYEGIILDPPAFGRGPKGEIWRFEEQLPELLALCRELLAERPRFVVLTAYAVTASALALGNILAGELGDLGGELTAGELALREEPAGEHRAGRGRGGRLLPTALYARWSARRSSPTT